jgi:hypothetical protein
MKTIEEQLRALEQELARQDAELAQATQAFEEGALHLDVSIPKECLEAIEEAFATRPSTNTNSFTHNAIRA